MTSRHLVDYELLPLLDALPSLDLSVQTLAAIRAASFVFPANPAAQVAVVASSITISGSAGAPDVGVRIYIPRRDVGPLPCVFHIHGGGYVAGSAAALEPVHSALAVAAQTASSPSTIGSLPGQVGYTSRAL